LDTKIKVFRNILVGFLVSSVARMDGHMFTWRQSDSFGIMLGTKIHYTFFF
jgi:hypothetical protein